MEFGKLLSDPTQRKRLIVVSAAVLLVVIVCAAVGLGGDIPPLTVFALILLAGSLGVIGKLLISVVVHLHGSAGRLKDLNDRYDDTERWLEQFDRGTRSALKSLGEAQGKLHGRAGEIEQSIKNLQDSIEVFATREAVEAATKTFSTDTAKLHENIGKLGKRVDQAAGEAKELSRAVQEAQDSRELIEASVESLGEELNTNLERVRESLDSKIAEQEKLRKTEIDSAMIESNEQVEKVGEKVREDLVALRTTVQTSSALASRLRGDGYVRFGRLVGAEFTESVKGEFGDKLGLSIETSQIRYLERKVQQVEAVSEGRLATTSEDAVARVMAARACQTEELKILEIGVLFGIGSAFMHTALVPFYKRVELFLLDPFDGYYGTDNLDPLTGQVITRAAVERNMKRAAIDPADVHILEGFSTDEKILKKTKAAGPFDVLVIDGDHTYDGVKADFELYADLVVEDGILIVDDYGSEDWPEVTKYVDETVMKDERFDSVGVLSRTAIFRRNQKAAPPKAKQAAKSISANSDAQGTGASKDKPTSNLSAKIGKKVASKKAAAKKTSKKTAKKASKKASTRKKAPTKSKQPEAVAQEIAGKPDPAKSVADSV